MYRLLRRWRSDRIAGEEYYEEIYSLLTQKLDLPTWKASIDSKLDIRLRADYIRLRSNIKIPKQRRLLVEAAVLEITREFYGGT